MSWISYNKLVSYTEGAIRPIVNAIKALRIFSTIQVGENAFTAENASDTVEFISGTNMEVKATNSGIEFASKTAQEVKDALDITVTESYLYASRWDDNGIYSYEDSYPSTDYILEIAKNGRLITTTEINAWNNAMLETTLLNTLVSKGTVPSVDIPIILTIRRIYAA